jgi:hypothetical protein
MLRVSPGDRHACLGFGAAQQDPVWTAAAQSTPYAAAERPAGGLQGSGSPAAGLAPILTVAAPRVSKYTNPVGVRNI